MLNTSYKSNIQSPESSGQMAFWDDSGSNGQAGRVSGQQDSARRGFGPVAVPYTNLAKSTPYQWTVVTGTVATGIAAPDGTANAARLSAPAGAFAMFVLIRIPTLAPAERRLVHRRRVGTRR